MVSPDWASLLWEARGYLGLDDGESVPRDELVEQAVANGYTKREAREAIRNTDALDLVGDLDGPHIALADAGENELLDDSHGDADCSEETASAPPTDDDRGTWTNADFTDPESGVWPPELLKREQWMGHVDKKPFAPWGDRNAPADCSKDGHDTVATCDCDARWKWGYTGHYVDGETVAMAEVDDRLDGRAFLQQEDGPYVYVDGDDVRDRQTGEVHPAFKTILEHLGLTYADVSQSGAGVHAQYHGEFPDGVKQAAWQLDDEPWGDNDELPSIEIYPGKRVCVATGEHVPGTPTEIREWNDDVLEPLLEANDDVASSQCDTPSTAHEDYDLDDYEPEATSATETTDDIRDIFAALDRLDARHVAERTIVHRWNDDASTTDGKRAFAPTWGQSSNGMANIVDDHIWQDTGDAGGYGGPVVMALIDAGEMSHRAASPRDATGELFWTGVAHLRDLGFDIPEYDPPTDPADHVAVLPDADRLDNATTGWDWRHAARESARDLTLDTARDRTKAGIGDAYDRGDRTLIEALPTLGKSYGAIAAAAETGEQITVLTGRGRKEQYAQFREWCEDHGLEYYTLPAFTHDCPTANGDHGAEWRETAMDWYDRGATPKAIHALAESVLDRPLPCQAHDGHECEYTSKWRFEPDEKDVLIGHYTHAHNQKVTQGRTVVFDEFPGGAYETQLDANGDLVRGVSCWLDRHDAVPFDDYTDLLENRADDARRAEALAWFRGDDARGGGIDTDEAHVFDDEHAHAAAPRVVFALLAADDLGNGIEVADFPETGQAVRNRETGALAVLQPPALEYASGVVALDGTPTKEMWETALGTRLNHRQILTDAERREYLRDALNLNLVRTTDAVKSYSAGETEISRRVSLDADTALLEEVRDRHGQRPDVITTARAEDVYRDDGALDQFAADTKHYGNVLGSNAFDDSRLGVVLGSRNFGPAYVKKWGAYLGVAVDPTFPSPDNDFAPTDYGPVGNQIRTHMTHHETLQAAMRFGRDGNGAVVYVHTNTLPEWVPLAGDGRVVTAWSDGMRQVLTAARTLGDWTTAELSAHPAVDLSRQQVFAHLETLRDRGVLAREQDPADGRRVRWRDTGLHRVNDHGEVELAPVELEAVARDEVRKLARTTYYRWEFTNSGGRDAGRAGHRATRGVTRPARDATGGDRPPDTP